MRSGDGKYGPNVAETVKAFQTSYNEQNKNKAGFVPLVVDGKFGPKTFSALKNWPVTQQQISDNRAAINKLIEARQSSSKK